MPYQPNVRALQAPGVFLVNCELAAQISGWVICSTPGACHLFDVDRPDNRYQVEMPALPPGYTLPAFISELDYVAIQNPGIPTGLL